MTFLAHIVDMVKKIKCATLSASGTKYFPMAGMNKSVENTSNINTNGVKSASHRG